MAAVQEEAYLRQLHPHWNFELIAASLAVSLLGAFTSTQLMCQARISLTFSSVLVWTLLGSLTFGFCGVWSLHEVAMLGYELDVQMGISGGLTILSAVLAVVITFFALASDLLLDRFKRMQKRKRRSARKSKTASASKKPFSAYVREREQSSAPLLQTAEVRDAEVRDAEEDERENYNDETSSRVSDEGNLDEDDENAILSDTPSSSGNQKNGSLRPPVYSSTSWARRGRSVDDIEAPISPGLADYEDSATERSDSLHRTLSDVSTSRRSSSILGSSGNSSVIGSMMNIAYWKAGASSKNAFVWTAEALYTGCTRWNILKGFSWSLAITSMHYVGLLGLKVPNGFIHFQPGFVIASAIISWVVCLVGCILMASMETHLQQQLLFAVVATTGVAAMHFTGMRAATFWSYEPPSAIDTRGYPPVLATAVVSIAITTCIAANGLLAHSATVSRNKLAEIVHTRKKLWRTIAQKENAEAAAAARSDFIASASHEIRTPLHHLQGYSDLLARTELTEEGRALLYAIQRATKTLSMITNNVLDWSKLERDAESVCRPVSLDMRTICESIIVLLPNKDDEEEVELLVVVTPDVPNSLFLDETYVHRVLMNLLSNALKFTRSGYILLLVEMEGGKLVATVKDTGCGVPSSFVPQMFEPFKQAQTRGNQRGTGLGLSIIKQLLHKMGGTVEVKSIHSDTGEVGPEKPGSTFTIRIPVPPSLTPPSELVVGGAPKVGILHGGNSRSLEGVVTSWEKFGYEVDTPRGFSELSLVDYKYIWVDVPYLQQNPEHFRQLKKRQHATILVPYDSQDTLQQFPELQCLSHFVLLQKPLVWHSFQKRISAVTQPSKIPSTPSRTVRFASKVDLLDGDDTEKPQKGATAKNLVVLLVEDNSINQKLGKKMLSSLGYQVLTADDGQDAIEQIVKHDTIVDAILMDQSMPRKDGITATKEIREMEASGVLSRSRPIIAVTAVVNSQAQALFKEAGADDFLAKPLSLAKLEQTLAAHVYVK